MGPIEISDFLSVRFLFLIAYKKRVSFFLTNLSIILSMFGYIKNGGKLKEKIIILKNWKKKKKEEMAGPSKQRIIYALKNDS